MSYLEKRRFPRKDAYHLISFYLLDENENIVDAGVGETENISDGGLQIVTNKVIQSQHILLVIRDEKRNVVDLKGKVIYSRKNNNDKVYIGIEFIGEDTKKAHFANCLKKVSNNLGSTMQKL